MLAALVLVGVVIGLVIVYYYHDISQIFDLTAHGLRRPAGG